MQRGFAPIFVLVGLVIVAAVLFTPIPYYFNGFCDIPCISPETCSCLQKGWHLGKPLWKQIAERYNSSSKEEKLIQIVTPSPTQQPSQADETANWKTYTNKNLEFSFEYPVDWSLTGGGSNTVTIQVSKNETMLSFYPVNSPEKIVTDLNITKKEIINVGDYPVPFNFYTSTITNQPSAFVDLSTNNKFNKTIKMINFYLSSHQQEEDLKIIKNILSTFKFLPASLAGGDQKQVTNSSKACQQDSDCILLQCSGCFNKAWVKIAPSDLSCMTYSGYNCQCVSNKCLEIK